MGRRLDVTAEGLDVTLGRDMSSLDVTLGRDILGRDILGRDPVTFVCDPWT